MFDFLRRKRRADDFELPPLPELPDFPEEIPSLKSLEQEASRRSEEQDDIPPMPPPMLETPIAVPKFAPKDVMPEEPARTQMPRQKGVFIKVDSFRTLIADLDGIRADLREYQKKIGEFEMTRKEEEVLFGRWQKSVNDAQKKIISVDRTLFEVGK
ncbi:hypothetical protein HY638_01525 [Candidatus Woesearchaeota archaeon]|nr:hypothetical protein [Candidatus Woesearchaeota archaeon]